MPRPLATATTIERPDVLAHAALVLMVLGASLGASLAKQGIAFLGALLGSLAGLAIGEVAHVHRIVSFIGVGMLMLVIGYFSPLPPAAEETR